VSCSFSAFEEYGHEYRTVQPREECKYWPVKPVRPLRTCLQTYTNDFLYGTDANMWEVATQYEGNNVRRIVFEPQEGVDGGHSESRDWLSWEVSCLEITEPCGETCEAAMMDCVGLGVRGCLVENDE